ncbi:uncharacterized protein ColSpa_12776 [Colletotrichum spaethianum]|uniref:Uncharacterized protein n=1 Tax=Colletotrichum spaethianum TaxID=700344 RepID=A0AA37PHT8_9PEZI|nr:uncharacterized protein ColSpa_12776 [Colletotrichum spaethianum]GKT52595.1 hypothetical protein ColSpa_12776 [Colletotrichum spaethianum]
MQPSGPARHPEPTDANQAANHRGRSSPSAAAEKGKRKGPSLVSPTDRVADGRTGMGTPLCFCSAI